MLNLTGQTIYILPLKLSDSVIEELKTKIRQHNGVAVSCIGMHRANVILTCVRSPQRLERHITTRRATVVHLDWLKECLQKQETLCMKEFQIELPKLPDDVILISSDEENTMNPRSTFSSTSFSNTPSPTTSTGSSNVPLQARSMEDIGLAYYRTLSLGSSYRRNTSSSQLSDDDTTTSEDEPTDKEESSLDADQLNSHNLVLKSTVKGEPPRKLNRGFACQHPVPSDYPNKELVEIFQRMQQFRELDGDAFSAKAYRAAVVALKCYPDPLTHINQVRQIRNVGSKITRMIEDYLANGRILDYEELECSPRYKVLEMFYNVHGVGFEVAQRWYQKGYRSLEAVCKQERLTAAQAVGVELYHDFLEKMSRSDVEEVVKTLMEQVNSFAEGYEYTICGSYRRKCERMGDIDIVISHQNDVRTIGFLSKLLDQLQTKGLITHLLSASVHHSRLIHAPITYNRTDLALVVWQQPGQTIHRRLDIIVAPWHQYHPAILAWTGSKHFEQSLRLFAKKKRFKVTHHGIFCRSTGNLIPVHSELEAFNVLGLQFLEPDKRNF